MIIITSVYSCQGVKKAIQQIIFICFFNISSFWEKSSIFVGIGLSTGKVIVEGLKG